MANRNTTSSLSTPPIAGADYVDEVAGHFATLFDKIALPVTGAAGTNAYTGTVDPIFDAGGLSSGMIFSVVWPNTNTAGATLNINSEGAISVRDPHGATCVSGTLVSGRRDFMMYDGTNFVLFNPVPATQALAEAGVNNTHHMTPLRTKQAIDVLSDTTVRGWHPYDMLLVGDGNDGLIWDHSVDGSVSTIETPNFEDGYDYMLVLEEVSISSSAAGDIDGYRATDAAWTTITDATTTSAPSNHSGQLTALLPRRDSKIHEFHGLIRRTDADVSTHAGSAYIWDTTVQKIGKMRLNVTSGNFDNGEVYLLRRREYFTG